MIDPDWAQEQLDERLKLGYIRWPGKQSDAQDKRTNRLMYQFPPFKQYLEALNSITDTKKQKDYAIIRYTNLLVHDGAIASACRLPGVIEYPIPRQEIDFVLVNYVQDLKTAGWPFAYGKKWTLEYAQQNPVHLAQWFYENQSPDAARNKNQNRLFVVMYARNGQHWRLKCDLKGVRATLDEYITSGAYTNPKLVYFRNRWVVTDIVWHIV